MSDETTGTPHRRSMREQFNAAPSWQVALIAVAVAWLGKGGCDRLAESFLNDSRSFEAVALEKLTNIEAKQDRMWQIRGPKQSEQAQGP